MTVRESIARARKAQAKPEQQAKQRAHEQNLAAAANAANAARKIGLIRRGLASSHATIDAAANAARARIQQLARNPL